jgi:hypothetical protein
LHDLEITSTEGEKDPFGLPDLVIEVNDEVIHKSLLNAFFVLGPAESP